MENTPGPWMVIHDATRFAIHATRPFGWAPGEDTQGPPRWLEPSEHPQRLVGFVPRTDGCVRSQISEFADAKLFAAAPVLADAARFCVALCEEIGATETNAYAQSRSALLTAGLSVA